MNADRLLAHYERVADAPDSISRLRRFILNLAVRGKLVEQNPNDEPASELLKRIAVEKARLVKAGEIRGRKALPAVDEPPFDLPQNWRWTRTREVASDRGQEIPQATFTYIDVTAIDKESGVVANPKVLEASEAPSRARKILRKGDVIYSCVRPYLLNVAVIETDFNPEPIASTAFAIVNGHGLVLPRYLWIVLRSPFMVQCVEDNQRGQAYPAINDADFAVLPFPLPPLAEQHRIVAKVDELMALCDGLEAARTQREATRDRLAAASLARLDAPDPDPAIFRVHAAFALENLAPLTTRLDQIKALRQTILNLAVRGKLVEQDPKDGPASELLERIATEKARLLKAREVRDPLLSESGDALSDCSPLPASWECVNVAEVAYLRSGVALSHDEEQPTGDIPYLKVADLSLAANEHGITTSSRFVGSDRSSDAIGAGSIVFPKRGGAIATNRKRVARVAIVGDSNLMAMKPYFDDTLPFIEMWFNSFDLWVLNSGTSVPQINNKDIYPLALPLPPLAEQHRIVAKVDALVALCDRLEVALTTADATRQRLLKALLHEALVPGEEREEAA